MAIVNAHVVAIDQGIHAVEKRVPSEMTISTKPFPTLLGALAEFWFVFPKDDASHVGTAIPTESELGDSAEQ